MEYAPSSLSLSSDSLNNPYCGWYHTYNYTIKEDSTLDTSLIEAAQALDAGTQLCLLDVNINAYSNIDITPHAASELKAILSAWSNSGKQIILRIDYGNADYRNSCRAHGHIQGISSYGAVGPNYF